MDNLENQIIEEETTKKKRGRKPSKDKRMYFGEKEEKAVVDYLTASGDEKEKIFNEILKPAFTKMIESIIRRYNLYPPDEEFLETFDDTMSFLITKISCFNPNSSYKAYSYCGTICKNYLIYKLNQFSKFQRRNVSYDNEDEPIGEKLSDNIEYSYTDGGTSEQLACELTGTALTSIDGILEDKNEERKLTENEKKVGEALSYLMNNWEEMFVCVGSNKFNRSSINLYLREMTGLQPNEIREAMKVFKQGYFESKFKLLNE